MFGVNQGGWSAFGSAFLKALEHRYIPKKSPDLKTRTLKDYLRSLSYPSPELPAGIALLRLA
jgi:hypothetical protein